MKPLLRAKFENGIYEDKSYNYNILIESLDSGKNKYGRFFFEVIRFDK